MSFENVSSQPVRSAYPCSESLTKALSPFRDEECMRGVVDVSSVVTQALGAAGSQTKLIPILNIISTPAYLIHAVSEAKERVQAFKLAISTSQIAKAIFWGGRAIDSIGTAISDIVQPFAGGAELTGLSHIEAINTIFSSVIPIILIVFGAVAGICETWAMKKTVTALKEFEGKRKDLDGSLTKLSSLLNILRAVPANESDAKGLLERFERNEIYFGSENRQESIQRKIETLFAEIDVTPIQKGKTALEKIDLTFKKEETQGQELVEEIENLFKNLLSKEVNFSTLDQTEALYEKLLSKCKNPLIKDNKGLSELTSKLDEALKEIQGLKTSFLEKGNYIVELEVSELHRKLCIHAVIILMAALTLTSGILYLLDPKYQSIATGLGITSSVIDLLLILSNKKISEEQFHKLTRVFVSRH